MKVTISAARADHSYKTALATQNAGLLEKYYTTLYFKPESLWGSFLVSFSDRFGSLKSLLNRLKSNRYLKGLESRNVVSITTPELLGRAWRHIPLLRNLFPWNKLKDNLFDLLVSREIKDCDIFHGWLGYSLNTLSKFGESRTKILIDVYTAHPEHRRKLLSEEYEKFNLNCRIPDEPLWKKYVKEMELADYLLAPSEYVYNSCTSEGVPEEKIKVIPFGVDLQRFKPVKKSDSLFRLLFVGMISINKGVYYLLEAYKQLHLPKSELVLIGHLQPEFKNIITKYNGLFRHLPHVPNGQLLNWYGGSSAFVFPSLTEGSAMVTYEAMACGIPSIVTENSGSVVRDKVDGFVIPIRDIESLKEKILFFYENEEKRKEMGKSARERAEQFTWERYGNQLIKFYERIV
ncbi:MAG TPA: glycosyltransferase family 4 protein [candidate division Zixibacteria bacterium]